MKNVVLIMQDHQLYFDHPAIKRPCFDAFRQKGTHFVNARSVTPLCCPARRSILNGMYAHRHGLYNNKVNAPFDEQTYFDVLNANGYEGNNYYFGKWHAGPGESSDFKCKGFTPPGYSSPYKYPEYDEYLKQHGFDPNPAARVDIGLSDLNKYYEGAVVPLKEIRNLFTLSFGELLGDNEELHECFFLASLACEQLEKLKEEGKPFTLRVDFWGPHQPYFPTKKYLDMYREEDIPLYPSLNDDLKGRPDIYHSENAVGLSKDNRLIQPTPLSDAQWRKMLRYAYAENTLADAAAGRIVDKIFSLGLDKDTLIIWSADHGDALCSHGGHMDKDAYMSSEVLNIPLALYSPDREGGITDNRPASNVDMPVTMLDALGLKFDDESVRVGESLLKPAKRDYFVSVTHGHFTPHVALSVEKDGYRYVKNYDDVSELYDMTADPYSLVNLALNPEYAEKTEYFEKLLAKWIKDNDFKPYK